ncbi:MAG TPA: MFS transporter [Streptosporangiaceae bacterium]
MLSGLGRLSRLGRPGKLGALGRRPLGRRPLGRQFRWLWTAYAVSAYGSWLGFGAFPLVAILVLHCGPAEVSALSAAGLAVGAVVAVPLGPWVEFRRKRPVMMPTDLIRFVALASIPAAFALGWLSFTQLLVVSVITAAAKIAFGTASGAYLKRVVAPGDLLVANARFESTMWSATVTGPPLGGAAIGLFGPVTTILADAVSYLLSAAGVGMIGAGGGAAAREPRPVRATASRLRPGELLDGWRYLLTHPVLRPLLLNRLLVGGLIMATEPLVAVLMLGDLHFPPWQYGLSFAVPCAGGLIGSRLASRLVARFGRHRVMLAVGWLRAIWPVGMAFIQPGVAGVVLVIVVQMGLITCMGVYNPVLATYRLEQTPADRVARMLSAWSVSGSITTAALTALWGVLASLTSPRIGIAVAGVFMLGTPLLLPRRDRTPQSERELAGSPS